MIQLDIRSRQPIYEQLVEKFKELIVYDVLHADEQLPSVRQLAKELTINPNTIQKAYRELERQNFTYSVPGRGSFVAPQEKNEQKVNEMKDELRKLFSEALYLGLQKEEILEILHSVESFDGEEDQK
ncbi:GntR family transcriptional regulator [Bacillus fonticola]|uniref:GntR family transcriptional regulator n=1 Tax=Bacillus fonticola TaxID=2728853 RepID=UPI001474097D|nr:GntR family transcriptional regulator [Bacillus fonticola]